MPVSNLLIVIFQPLHQLGLNVCRKFIPPRSVLCIFHHRWPWIIPVPPTRTTKMDVVCLQGGGMKVGLIPHSEWVIAQGWKTRWASCKTKSSSGSSDLFSVFFFFLEMMDLLEIGSLAAAAYNYFNCQLILWFSVLKCQTVVTKTQDDILKCLVSSTAQSLLFRNQKIFISKMLITKITDR